MFEKYLEACDDWGKEFYGAEIEKLSDEKKAQLVELINKMEQCGCPSAMTYAFSEVTEGIPQFARYLVLKQLFDIADDVEGAYFNAVDYCECSESITDDFAEMHKQMTQAVGEENLNKYLKLYNRGMISSFISLLDEGACNTDIGFGWALVKVDSQGNVMGNKCIEALHEDFYDFEK